ncbi:MAG TPA: toll/interleukin-1 receptor domain-containing protein [Candidatus Baltobacteraceae bacterium]|jgi:hypothetical protein|nr:toll/interleukin-1 receptor domain-containing protein [Candidatus Baltobacteraceae bacterium]
MAEIFISYTHKDNVRLSGEECGWIDLFHEALRVRLASLAGYEVGIWRDPKTTGNDLLTPRIEHEVAQASFFVAVLSPAYMNSQWCQKEMRVFAETAKMRGGLNLGAKSRFIKVIKTPIDLRHHAQTPAGEHFAELLGYKFYALNDRGVPLEVDPRFGSSQKRDFCVAVNEVAYDISLALADFNGNGVAEHDATTRRIYVAETSFDVTPDRDRVRRELQQYGYIVLPERAYEYSSHYVDRVRDDLLQCALSVHPIGKSYGIVPEGDSKSIVALQYETALETSRDTGLTVLPWMPADFMSRDDRLNRFIEKVRDDPRLFIGPIENLKAVIHDALNEPRRVDTIVQGRKADGRWLYAICDKADCDSVKPYEDALIERGIDVALPLFEGDESEMRLDHVENLKNCDAALIYYGRGSEYWFRSKLLDLRKTFGYGRTRPFLLKAVLLADPRGSSKDQFRSAELVVINAYGAFTTSHVDAIYHAFHTEHEPAI